jgi:hypothetical protein
MTIAEIIKELSRQGIGQLLIEDASALQYCDDIAQRETGDQCHELLQLKRDGYP